MKNHQHEPLHPCWYLRDAPDLGPSDIEPLTLVLPTKTLLRCHHRRLRDSVSAFYATAGQTVEIRHPPHRYLKAPSLGLPNCCFQSYERRVSILSCASYVSSVE